jgi:hypothetical protein
MSTHSGVYPKMVSWARRAGSSAFLAVVVLLVLMAGSQGGSSGQSAASVDKVTEKGQLPPYPDGLTWGIPMSSDQTKRVWGWGLYPKYTRTPVGAGNCRMEEAYLTLYNDGRAEWRAIVFTMARGHDSWGVKSLSLYNSEGQMLSRIQNGDRNDFWGPEMGVDQYGPDHAQVWTNSQLTLPREQWGQVSAVQGDWHC